MNLQEIRELQAMRLYPSVTITMPTHRTSPENRQDPIRLKNLLTEVTNRLTSEFTEREVQDIVDKLDRLARGIDFRYALDGLALFVNKDFAKAVQVPFRLKERTVVDETFATRDLVWGLNHSTRYWVLVLSERPTRLFEGIGEHLFEVEREGFPMVHEGPGGEAPLPAEYGIDKSAYRDERHRQFFRRVDAALKVFMAADPLPLVLVGVDRYLSFFREVSAHRDQVIASVQGSHDKTPPHALAKLVWPFVLDYRNGQVREGLAQLEKAVNARRYVAGIDEVWRMAHQGRGELLLVEEGYLFPAMLGPEGRLIPAEDPTAPGAIDDAVDEIIEAVLAKKGKVVFAGDGQLADFARIALVLRF